MIIDKETRDEVGDAFQAAACREPVMLTAMAILARAASSDLVGMVTEETGEYVTKARALWAVALAHDMSNQLEDMDKQAHDTLATAAFGLRLCHLMSTDLPVAEKLNEMVDRDALQEYCIETLFRTIKTLYNSQHSEGTQP